jgi:hypothetical protein
MGERVMRNMMAWTRAHHCALWPTEPVRAQLVVVVAARFLYKRRRTRLDAAQGFQYDAVHHCATWLGESADQLGSAAEEFWHDIELARRDDSSSSRLEPMVGASYNAQCVRETVGALWWW